jgi:hypothetical protein
MDLLKGARPRGHSRCSNAIGLWLHLFRLLVEGVNFSCYGPQRRFAALPQSFRSRG